MKKILSVVTSALIIISMPLSINAYADEHDSNTEPTTEYVEPTTTEQDEPAQNGDISISDAPDITEEPPLDVPDLYEPTTEYIPVEDIELSEFKEEMFVKDTQDLSATIIPANASEQTVHYSSSNSSVARINSIGKLTAVGKGSCRIYISCDNMTVYYDLRVKVKTESINVKSKYIVIKPDEKFDLETSVQPAEASQELSFKSNDEEVATVDSNGIITAKSSGSTSIIISNDDSTILVNVIVSTDSEKTSSQKNDFYNLKDSNGDIDDLAEQISKSTENHITVKELSKVSSDVLKELYGTDKVLTIEYPDYNVLINGRDIINPINELNPELEISIIKQGILINYISTDEMPGAITIILKNHMNDYKHLYILSDKGNYTELSYNSDYKIKISSPGKYILSTQNMNGFRFNIVWILLILGILLVGSIIYIFSKKKYWLW